jgi:hypothetical protein
MLNTFPDFSTTWLVRGIGPMLEADVKKEQKKDTYNESMNERLKLVEEKIEQLSGIGVYSGSIIKPLKLGLEKCPLIIEYFPRELFMPVKLSENLNKK